MKFLVALCVLAFVALSSGDSIDSADPRPGDNGCQYIMGRCYKQCEAGTRAYATGCSELTPEATCVEPNPVPDKWGKFCDYSACYCISPTVRDTVSGQCVKLEDCPPKKDHKDQKDKKE